MLRPTATIHLLSGLVLACVLGAACGDGDDDSGGDGDDGGGVVDASPGDAGIDAAGDPGIDSGPRVDASPIGPGDFSFFRASFEALQAACDNPLGCGGDLGGLAGADAICNEIAATVGAGGHNWKAFLSATNGGSPIHAIDRIGTGPWYDANGVLVANNIAGLIAGPRPEGDSAGNLPDEFGTLQPEDNDPGHDVLTGSDDVGQLRNSDPASTCNDWTSSSEGLGGGLVGVGHGAIAGSINPGWIRAHTVGGCAAGYDFEGMVGGPVENSVGSGNGYGAIYCFVSNE